MQVRAVISGKSCVKLNELGGAVAQLGARLDGIEEVVGSNPIGSTNCTISDFLSRPAMQPAGVFTGLTVGATLFQELLHGNDPPLAIAF